MNVKPFDALLMVYKRPTAQTFQLGELNVGFRQISVLTELILKQ